MHARRNALEIGNTAIAVLLSLFQSLSDKKILSNREIRAILMKAASQFEPHEYATPVKGEAGIILNDLLPRFPEDGGD
jgi:hypothetical protein